MTDNELLAKKEAMLLYLKDYCNAEDLTVDDIKVDGDDKYAYFHTPEGTFHIMTDEEADEAHVEEMENFIDDCGIEGFTESAQEYIYDNYCKWNDGETALEESTMGYLDDIENESAGDPNFDNRLQKELFEFTHEDYESQEYSFEDVMKIKQWFDNYEDNKDDLKDAYVEGRKAEYDYDYIAWLKDCFGDAEVKAIKDSLTIDYEGISEYVKSEDGRGHTLAGWDGKENEVYSGNTYFYLYQIDDEVYIREHEEDNDEHDI